MYYYTSNKITELLQNDILENLKYIWFGLQNICFNIIIKKYLYFFVFCSVFHIFYLLKLKKQIFSEESAQKLAKQGDGTLKQNRNN